MRPALTRAALAVVLAADAVLEMAGMPADHRRTCHPCRTWADHAHHHITGARMSLDEFAATYGGTEKGRP